MATLAPLPATANAVRLRRLAVALWLAALALLLGAHYVHLSADFPNYSQWNDWAKYTDEGWYANAAIRMQISGAWYHPGAFNPAVAVPIWPALAAVLFHFTGRSLMALRALTVSIFLLDLGLMYLLLRLWERRSLALLGVTLAGASAFLCAFSRIAILEPLLVACFLAALLLAHGAATAQTAWRRSALAAGLGAMLCTMVLVKTTGVCLMPAIAWMLWWPQHSRHSGGRRWDVAGSAAVTAVTACALWAVYFWGWVHPRYLADYRYFFTANVWPKPVGLRGWLWNTWFTAHGLFWTGRLLPCVGIAVLLLALRPLRELWRNPLFVASLLSAAGVLFFIWWHNNTQPRYYVVLTPGLIFVATLGAGALLEQRRAGGVAACTLLGIACVTGAWRILNTAAHPEYSYLRAAQSLTQYIDRHPDANRMLLSISGDEIGLMTGLPSLCDDYGVDELPIRIDRYRPGWYASWNDVDGGTLEDIHVSYRLVRVASYPALDDPERNQLILYRMLPQPGPDKGVTVDNDP